MDAERRTIKGDGWIAFRRGDQWILKFKINGSWSQHRVPTRIESEADLRRYATTFLRAERLARKQEAPTVPLAIVVAAGIHPEITFRDLARLWTSGELAKMFPDHVRVKRSVATDVSRLNAHVLPRIGDRLVREFKDSAGLDLADSVMRSLPPVEVFGRDSRRQVAQVIRRLLGLAVYPLRLLPVNPLPKGWLPRPSEQKSKSYLYPGEDERLLECTRVSLLRRLFYGFLVREGLRASEARALCIEDIDFEHGIVHLAVNKTEDPRSWTLGPGVADALRRYLDRYRPGASGSEYVFVDPAGRRAPGDNLARALRKDLKTAKITRKQLFEKDSHRLHIRGHDLRATFVTVHLATGKTETWVSDRTGHKSSQMIARYRRAARTHVESNLGTLRNLVDAIPELRGDSAGPTKAKHLTAVPSSDEPDSGTNGAHEADRGLDNNGADEAPPSSGRRPSRSKK